MSDIEREEFEPVATINAAHCFDVEDASRLMRLPAGTKLYTHPARQAVSVPGDEYIRALQDAFDIIQADANTEQNYGSLCRMGGILGKLKAKQEKDND